MYGTGISGPSNAEGCLSAPMPTDMHSLSLLCSVFPPYWSVFQGRHCTLLKNRTPGVQKRTFSTFAFQPLMHPFAGYYDSLTHSLSLL